MSGAKSIKEYAEICFLCDREPDQAEFLAMMMFGILPDWINELA